MFFENIYSLKIFSWLEKEVVDQIVNNSEERSYNAGDIIIFESEAANWEWYILKKWRVMVSIWWQDIVSLNPWDIFWELALLSEEKRTATVRAETDITVIVLNMDNLITILNNDNNWLNKTILRRIEENLERE